MITFNDVIPVLNLSVFNVRRASTFTFEQSKRTAIGGRFIRVDKSRDLPLLYVVEDFPQEPVCGFAVTTWGEVKIDSTTPVVNSPVQVSPASIDLYVRFINVPRAKIGRISPGSHCLTNCPISRNVMLSGKKSARCMVTTPGHRHCLHSLNNRPPTLFTAMSLPALSPRS